MIGAVDDGSFSGRAGVSASGVLPALASVRIFRRL